MMNRASQAFDLGHLERQTFGDPDLRRELLRLFAGQCERLRPLVVSDDAAASREAAHALKGAAQALGAFRIAELCEIIETASEENRRRRSAVVDLADAIAAALQAVTAESDAGPGRSSLAKTGRLA